MFVDVGAAAPLPPRTTTTVRIDSPEEGEAFLVAYPSSAGPWVVESRLRVNIAERTEEHVGVRSFDGTRSVVRFDVSSFVEGEGGDARHAAAGLDDLLQRAAAFAKENGPHHPGDLPRFPVPSEGYPGRVEVPLAILAVDRGRRGLYAPARVVVLAYPDGDPYGVGDFPGFDPERWPPRRLGDWPPEGMGGFDETRLRGTVARFGACWRRLLAAWLRGVDYPQRADESAEARALLTRLDPPGMAGIYEQLAPSFWHWLVA